MIVLRPSEIYISTANVDMRKVTVKPSPHNVKKPSCYRRHYFFTIDLIKILTG